MTDELQVDFLDRFTLTLLSNLNLNKDILLIIRIYYIQKNKYNYRFNVFLNIEDLICRYNEFIEDPAKKNNTRRWHDREEVIELRFRIVKLLHKITGVTSPQIRSVHSRLKILNFIY